MYDEETRVAAIKLLQAAGVAEAAGEPFDLPEIAQELDRSVPGIEMEIEQFQHRGLLLTRDEPHAPPLLLNAGRQYLASGGGWSDEVLRFLPRAIDDLNTRAALLTAGTILVDEFRDAILSDGGVEHAAELVPPAFASAVDDYLAMNLYSAAVALMARLSSGDAAGCVAEEIMAVALMEEARVHLDMSVDLGEITEEEAKAAEAELSGLFELFEDDDVLNLFDMAEPADAALAGHDPINRQMGVADQRIEAWFHPFGGTAPTGYLADDSSDDEDPEDDD